MKISAVDANYKAPDELETNADILRAELLAVATPEMKEHLSDVYSSLKLIQSTCAYDWKTACLNDGQQDKDSVVIETTSEPLKLGETQAKPILNRNFNSMNQLADSISSNDGRILLSSLKQSLLLNRFKSSAPLKDADGGEIKARYEVKPMKPSPHLIPPVVEEASGVLKNHEPMKLAVMKDEDLVRPASRKLHFGLHDHQHASDSDSDSDGEEEDSPRGKSVKPKPGPKFSPKPKLDPKQKQMAGPPFPAAPLKFGGSETERKGEIVDATPSEDVKRHPCGFKGPGVAPDDVFVGALGYGAQIDACMYSHYKQLSTPCQDAISSLYQTRQAYWTSAEAVPPPPPPPLHGGFPLFPILYFLLIGVALKRFGYGIKCGRHREMRQKVGKILETIKANPELRAAVEAASGEQIPEPPAFACRGKYGCFKGILCMAANFIIVLLIGFSALILTGHIVESTVHHDPKTGEVENPPSAIFVIITLISIVAGEIFLFKKLLSCRSQSRPPVDIASHGSSPAHGGSGFHGEVFTRMLVPLQSLNIFGQSRGNRSPGYSPLINGDEVDRSDAEMVDLRQQQSQSHTSPFSAYPGVPIQGVVYAPAVVTANPMTTVRMV